MKTKSKLGAVCILIFGLFLSGCGSGQLFGPTATPTPTITNTPTFTPTATFTPAATATITPTATKVLPTPVSACSPYASVQGKVNDAIPGYINILAVSTSLDGTKLTAVFNLREIPNEITVNKNSLADGSPEIAWGVDIDTDNNPKTGIPSGLMFNSGYGYDATLQAFNYKSARERNNSIQNFFQDKTFVWTKTGNGNEITTGAYGDITVDQGAKTITLSADIKGITPNSYLHFFTFLNDNNKIIVDEVCKR